MLYMKDLDTMYTDATCYEIEMRYPTDPKFLWEEIENAYEIMYTLRAELNVHRPRTKYVDVEKANLSYRKPRRYTKIQTRKLTRRLLNLMGKILKQTRRLDRENTGRRACRQSGRVTLKSSRGCTASRRTTSKITTHARVSRTE